MLDLYFNENAVNILKNSIKDTRDSFCSDIGSLWVPIQYGVLDLGSERISPYCEGGSMIPVDLSTNCEGWIYDPKLRTDLGSRSLGSNRHDVISYDISRGHY